MFFKHMSSLVIFWRFPAYNSHSVRSYEPQDVTFYMKNTKELMHCHCGTNNKAPRLTFTDPCEPEVRPGAREESASPAWLAA